MSKKLSTAIQSLELAIFSSMAPYGEHIQNETLLGNQQYNWWVGHTTDIGISGAVASLCMLLDKQNKSKYALIVPSAMSAVEALTSLHPKINFDWQDIGCYYGTALFVYGVNKILKFYQSY